MTRQHNYLSDTLRPGLVRYKVMYLESLHERVGSWLLACPQLAMQSFTRPYFEALLYCAGEEMSLNQLIDYLGLPRTFRETKFNKKARVYDYQAHPEFSSLAREANSEWHWAIESMKTWSFGLAAVKWMFKKWPDESRHARKDEFNYILHYWEEHGFKPNWSWNRTVKEHDRWVNELKTAKVIEAATSPKNQVEIDYGSIPDEITLTYQDKEVKVRALRKKGDLMIEAAQMSHCVGGVSYQNKLAAQTSQFFRLSSEAEETTLQVILRNDSLIIEEHKGVRNANPSELHCDIATQLCSSHIDKSVMKESLIDDGGLRPYDRNLVHRMYRPDAWALGRELGYISNVHGVANFLQDLCRERGLHNVDVRVERGFDRASDTVRLHCRDSDYLTVIQLTHGINGYDEHELKYQFEQFRYNREAVIRAKFGIRDERREPDGTGDREWRCHADARTVLIVDDPALSDWRDNNGSE